MKKAPNMNLKKEIAKRIRKIRWDAGLSQEKFAQSISVSRVHLNRMEAPDVEMMPSNPVLKRICKCYKVEMDWLMTGFGHMYEEGTNTLGEEERENFESIDAAYRKHLIEYSALKMAELLKKGDLEPSIFKFYFNFVAQHTSIFFDFLTEAKKNLETHGEISDNIYPSYLSSIKQK